MDNRPNTKTNIDLTTFIEQEVKLKETAILSGTNNCGKSYLLREIYKSLGHKAHYLACQRFYNIQQFSSRLKQQNEEQQFFSNFLNLYNQSQNFDQGVTDLNTSLTGLNKQQLDLVLKLCTELIGDKFEIRPVNEDSYFSPLYIAVNGYNMSYSSSGTRLLMTILSSMVNPAFETILLDEPELGLNPSLQTKLAEIFYNLEKRKSYFPHLKNIYISTHSHLFLNRNNILDNYALHKTGEMLYINQIKTMNDFHNLQFNLLGNTFESLFLPSIVLILEGKTDFKYLKRVTKLLFPDSGISYLQANSDSEIIPNLNKVSDFLGGLTTSPYRDRIFVVLDETHSPSIITGLTNKGVVSENIVEWNKNGIEFYYPKEIIESIFSCSYSDFEAINLTGTDRITLNGITKTKNELCDEVISVLNTTSIYNAEFKNKLLSKIKSKIG